MAQKETKKYVATPAVKALYQAVREDSVYRVGVHRRRYGDDSASFLPEDIQRKLDRYGEIRIAL